MVDPSLLQQASEVFEKLGTDTDSAITAFLSRVVTLGRMPFGEAVIGSMTKEDAIVALSDSFFRFYYVDMETDHFVRVSSEHDGWGEFTTSEGEDFFNYFVQRCTICIHPNDKSSVIHFMDRKYWETAPNGSPLSLTHRSIEFGEAKYHGIRGVKVNDRYLCVAISHVDDQVKALKVMKGRIKKARKEANRDGLTGLYNQRYFERTKKRINEKVRNKTVGRFSIVVCDLNNLKIVNDTQGHQAGDEYIKEGATRLQRAFDPCKVYRIGGDEFAIVAEKGAHDRCDMIVADLIDDSYKSLKNGHCVIAIGLASFDPNVDQDFSGVFLRADMAMYENKAKLKSIG